ncbi:hypothetical protein A9978_12625 [Pseudomonas sp. UMC65]|nr:hypothetical protein [Pseudomonas sp. UMC65]MBB1619241.1 hypothetical protein [Pseudomonas sp. UME65]
MNRYMPITGHDCNTPSLLIHTQAPIDVLHDAAAYRIRAVTQLQDTLLLGCQRFAHTCLPQLLSFVLLYPASNGRISDIKITTNLWNAQALIFDHLHDFQLEAVIECSAFVSYEKLLDRCIFHLSRCPGKLDHYKHSTRPAQKNTFRQPQQTLSQSNRKILLTLQKSINVFLTIKIHLGIIIYHSPSERFSYRTSNSH